MSLPRYPKYKDSSVEWLGEVPEHWKVKRLKFLCTVQTGDKDTVNAVEDGQYPFFVRSQTVERIDSFTHNCEAVLTAGDGVGVGKVFHYYKGPFDFHQRVYMLNNFQSVSGFYLFLYIKEQLYKVALEGGAKSTVDSLRMPLFLNFPITVPPPQEQSSIVAVLSTETAKIDALVEEQRRLIELLKEKRQAVISHVVTKGLNPHAKVKPSGIEWLGEVPEHWDQLKLKHTASKITDGAHISPETDGGEFYFVSTRDITESGVNFSSALLTSPATFEAMVSSGCKPKKGDVLFSKDGTIGKTVVIREDLDFVVASSLIIIRPDQHHVYSQFLHYLCQASLITAQVESLVKGAGLPRLSIQNLLKIEGLAPPLAEQLEISDFLDRETAKIDALISEAYRAIDLLQERRTALISAAVTGKIDVRGASDRVQ